MPTSVSTPTWVHIGFGAFHRGHQLVYLQHLNALGDAWRVCAISLNSVADIAQLHAQGMRFHVLEQDAQQSTLQEISCVSEALHPQRDGIAAIIARIAAADVAVISLTITEKGYGIKAGTLNLDWQLPALQHDKQHPAQPQSAVGVLVAVLAARRAAGRTGLTLLSCDNVRGNGRVLKAAVLEFAAAIDVGLAQWIAQGVRFPSTMVDRIVPAMTEDSRTQLLAAIRARGEMLVDHIGVVTEGFKQWVIEDDFIAARPALDKVGVSFVSDVTPFEEMKLRLLNGAHSGLAYMGSLAGYTTVSEAIADLHLQALIRAFMLNEQAPTLASMSRDACRQYADALMTRFANPHLQHRLLQIAMDGSQKLPQRLFPAIESNIHAGRSHAVATLALAAWLHFILGREVQDPLALVFRDIAQSEGVSLGGAQKILSLPGLLPDTLRADTAFIAAVCAAFSRIGDSGIKVELARVSRELRDIT